MFYFIYKITNLVNDKIYVGAHSTENLEDDYFGSGKHLRRAIKKYGIQNFKKEIVEYFDTSEQMFAREKEIVNEEFLSRKDVYNICLGGLGGFEYANSHPDKTKWVTEGGSLAGKILKERRVGIFNPELRPTWIKMGLKVCNLPENKEKAKASQRETYKREPVIKLVKRILVMVLAGFIRKVEKKVNA